jgi:uncharacterized membrane-anchored protein
VQNAVLAVLIGTTMLGMVIFTLRSRDRGRTGATQLMLGLAVGTLAAAAVLSVRTDLVPDQVEIRLAVISILVVSGLLVLIAVRRGH